MNSMMYLFVTLFVSIVTTAQGQECLSDGLCDKHERCAVWRAEGECFSSRDYMNQHCPVSCLQEDAANAASFSGACRDSHERCGTWAALGECNVNQKDMHKYCPRACGLCIPDEDDDDDYEDDEEDEDDEFDPSCSDNHERCSFWASHGECDANPNYMHANCARSCKTCQKVPRRVQQQQQQQASIASSSSSSSSMDDARVEEIQQQSSQFGVMQRAEGNHAPETLKRIEGSIEYMNSEDTTNLPQAILDSCQNRHELCSFWAVLGECEKNAAYMQTNCAPACKSCHLIDIEARCPKLEDAVPALYPGDLNKMFERIVATAPGNRTSDNPLSEDERRALQETLMPEYTVTVHSRPSSEPATEISAVQDRTLPPWVITFDNFITPEECEAMIQLGYDFGYKRSEDVGKMKFDGTHDSVKSEGRTSENAWCSDHAGCRKLEMPQRLHERIATVMGIPAENSEDFQILKYAHGQFYRPHHDYIPHQRERQCGPRILTFFLYLSDVEEGGGTHFPQLDITVKPKQGRALLWPSVLDSDPMKKDNRMFHEAQDVIKGTKFAANGWIHMYDYSGPQKRGCT